MESIAKKCGRATVRQCGSTEKWLNRACAVICLLAWTYMAMHIGSYIERQGLEAEQNLFLSHYSQKMEELKEKEKALVAAVRELRKRRL